MTRVDPGLANLGKYRRLCLHEQSADELRQVRQLAGEVRQARLAAGCSRRQLAERLAVDSELIVAIENGYGSAASARELLDLVRAACAR